MSRAKRSWTHAFDPRSQISDEMDAEDLSLLPTTEFNTPLHWGPPLMDHTAISENSSVSSAVILPEGMQAGLPASVSVHSFVPRSVSVGGPARLMAMNSEALQRSVSLPIFRPNDRPNPSAQTAPSAPIYDGRALMFL